MPGFNNRLVISAGSALAGAALSSFFTPPQRQPSKAVLNTQTCAAFLSKELLKNGWKITELSTGEPGLPSIYAGHFKGALGGGIAYAFIKQGNDYFILLNKQKRRENGELVYVVDMPCGFANVRQEGLVHTQRLIGSMGKLGAKKKLLTHADIQKMASDMLTENTSGHVNSVNVSPYPLIDKTPVAIALRELHEETGYIPVNQEGQLINVESLNEGNYYYFRYAFLDMLLPTESLPALKSALDEGISASCWVNVKDIKFTLDDSDQIIGGTAILNGETLALKSYDKMAPNLAHAIAETTHNTLGYAPNPGQSYERAAYDTPRLG